MTLHNSLCCRRYNRRRFDWNRLLPLVVSDLKDQQVDQEKTRSRKGKGPLSMLCGLNCRHGWINSLQSCLNNQGMSRLDIVRHIERQDTDSYGWHAIVHKNSFPPSEKRSGGGKAWVRENRSEEKCRQTHTQIAEATVHGDHQLLIERLSLSLSLVVTATFIPQPYQFRGCYRFSSHGYIWHR